MATTESGGGRLRYEVSGNPGGTLLVLANSLGSSVEELVGAVVKHLAEGEEIDG